MIKKLVKKECYKVLINNYIGQISFIVDGSPYMVPLTYYYHKKSNSILSYTKVGHKIKAMRKNDMVSVGVSEIDTVINWRSILVHGVFEELIGPDAKYYLHEFAKGVKKVIAKKEKTHVQFIREFSSELHSEGIPIVYRINIIKITGKYRSDQKNMNHEKLHKTL